MTEFLSSQNERQEFFPEDDEQILGKVALLQDGDADITPLLTGLAERLQEDWGIGNKAPTDLQSENDGEQYWKELVGKLSQNTVFLYSDVATQPINATSSSASASPPALAAFQTDDGKKHLAATTALSGLSEKRALQVTLGALRLLDVDDISAGSADAKDNSNFAVLFGTRELIQKTMEYHYQQRLARLSVLTECMRLEEDPDCKQRAAIVQFLDSLDQSFSQSADTDGSGIKALRRGLFKSLLVAGCRPDPTPTRAALEPCNVLETQVSGKWGGHISGSFQSFQTRLISQNLTQVIKERTQAMEGILTLLYGERMQGGVLRCDFALLISAFFDDSHGKGGKTRTLLDPRWKQLAGLICAECTALWKLMQPSPPGSTPGLSDHPMLNGLSAGKGKAEIEALIYALAQLTDAGSPQSLWMRGTERPESLAVMSFGLLLCLANDSGVPNPSLLLLGGKSPREYGTELVQVSSNQGRALDYLSTVMDALAGTALAMKPSSVKRDVLYDWQLSKFSVREDENVLMLQNEPASNANYAGPAPAVSADTVAYTSIAREIVAGSIAAFSDTVLDIESANSCENIGILCELAATIYKNNGPLCMQFCDAWDAYLLRINGPRSSTTKIFPICQLFDASHQLACRALDAVQMNRVSTEFFLSAVAPFFRMFSSLCHAHGVVETILGMIPGSMFRKALLCCGGTSVTDISKNEGLRRNQLSILDSFGTLAHVSTDSRSCLKKLRTTLEEDGAASQFDGPRVLARVIARDRFDDDVTCTVLHIFGHLLDSAPPQWAVLVSYQLLYESNSSTSRLITFLTASNEELSHSAVIVLAGLINHMSAVCSGALLQAHDAVRFLQHVSGCLLSAMTNLAAFTAAESVDRKGATTGRSSVSSQKAESILQSFSNFFKWIRPLTKGSGTLTEGAVHLRDELIQAIASNDLCSAVLYYAVAPASYTVLLRLEVEIRDSEVVEQVAQVGDAGSSQKYGAWASLFSTHKSESRSGVKAKISEFVSKMNQNDFDFVAMQDKGWLDATCDPNGHGALNASCAALCLLSEWSSHVEDIALTHAGNHVVGNKPMSNDVTKIIGNLSPQSVLFSLAPPPIPARFNSSLSALWHDMGFCTFELLLPYLPLIRHSVDALPDEKSSPASILLDFLNACIVQGKFVEDSKDMSQSHMVRNILQSVRLKTSLSLIIKNGIRISNDKKNTEAFSEYESNCLVNTFLSLRIVEIAVSCSSVIGTCVLEDTMWDLLWKTSLQAKQVLNLSGTGEVLASGADVMSMRVSGACMGVLASVWKVARRTSQTNISTEDGGFSFKRLTDDPEKFITEVADVVSSYANSEKHDGRISLTTEGESGRIGMMLFMSSALEVLAIEFASDQSEKLSTSALLDKFVRSRRFVELQALSISLNVNAEFCRFAMESNLQTCPIALFRSFPSTSSSSLSKDFYRHENGFDLRTCFQWLTDSTGPDWSTDPVAAKMLRKVTPPNLLASSELILMESFNSFLEIVAYDIYRKNDRMVPASSQQVLMYLARDILKGLVLNLRVVCEKMSVQTSFDEDETVVRMTSSLGKLLLFLVELGAFNLMPSEEVLDIVSEVAKAMDYLHNCMCPPAMSKGGTSNSAVEVSWYHRWHSFSFAISFCCSDKLLCNFLQTYCMLQGRFMGSVVILCGTLESKALTDQNASRQRDIYTTLCLVNCKFLLAFSRCCDIKNEKKRRDNCTTIRLCASFLSLIVLSDALKDLAFLGTIGGILVEFGSVRQLMQFAMLMSTVASETVASSESPMEAWVGDAMVLAPVRAVFILLQSITETNSLDLVTLLSSLELTQLVVRNPLFHAMLWSTQGSSTARPRGYVFQGERASVSTNASALAVGTEDPVFGLWLSAMHILKGCNRSITAGVKANNNQRIQGEFLDISAEFFKIYRSPLLMCLKSCGGKLTKNALKEAMVFLSLVAELSKRGSRDAFVHSCTDVFYEVLGEAKIVVSTLSKFIGATGNAQELFKAIQEYESSDSDRFDEQGTVPLSFAHARLLTEGLSSAKHEAIKFSHYASGRGEQITKTDFASSVSVPNFLKKLSVEDRSYENELERSCRLAVTSVFCLELVRDAANCLSQALLLIWRTHAISSSFYRFSEPISVLDLFQLVQPGIVVGYRPNVGMSLLDGRMGFLSLRFGIVTKVDTFSQQWEVEVIREEGALNSVQGVREKISPSQLAGSEDRSARKTPSELQAAPDSYVTFEQMPAGMTTGNYIFILRWCHQQIVLSQGNALDFGFEAPAMVRQLAEQASILLAADLVLADLNGQFKTKSKMEITQLDDQIFELFADKETLGTNTENDPRLISHNEGRMKNLLGNEVWTSIQQQVRPFVERSLKEKLEVQENKKMLMRVRRVRRRSGSFRGR
ncbi:MAG: hypothetical protein SGILL_001052 [Bacillariaceae sp.]